VLLFLLPIFVVLLVGFVSHITHPAIS